MSFIGSAIGSLTGSFAQKANDVKSPVSQAQLGTAYDQQQQAYQQQQAMLTQLQGQNGIQNQSNVFNQQQDLANQLQTQSNGGGPNPAQDMLNQNTSANTANQAALMAGQRGSSANAGLLARQASMQGSANQQAAVGQSATMGAQQQLAAQQQLQGQQQNMGHLASQQVGQQQQAISGANSNALNAQSNLLGIQNSNNAQNAQVNQGNVAGANQLTGAFLGAGATALTASGGGKAHGGMITPVGPQSRVGQHLHAMKSGGAVAGRATVAGDDSKNDTVPTMLSPGEIVIPRSITQSADAGKKAASFVEQVLAKQALKARK